jgi:hypothetical protein
MVGVGGRAGGSSGFARVWWVEVGIDVGNDEGDLIGVVGDSEGGGRATKGSFDSLFEVPKADSDYDAWPRCSNGGNLAEVLVDVDGERMEVLLIPHRLEEELNDSDSAAFLRLLVRFPRSRRPKKQQSGGKGVPALFAEAKYKLPPACCRIVCEKNCSVQSGSLFFREKSRTSTVKQTFLCSCSKVVHTRGCEDVVLPTVLITVAVENHVVDLLHHPSHLVRLTRSFGLNTPEFVLP